MDSRLRGNDGFISNGDLFYLCVPCVFAVKLQHNELCLRTAPDTRIHLAVQEGAARPTEPAVRDSRA